jgi:hypothetical protein
MWSLILGGLIFVIMGVVSILTRGGGAGGGPPPQWVLKWRPARRWYESEWYRRSYWLALPTLIVPGIILIILGIVLA